MKSDNQHTDDTLKHHVEEELDKALEQTFPASDPVSLTQPENHDIPRR
jgi:hypothetical protein